MRATGRYYYLTVISAALPVFSLTLLALMDDKSGTFYTWFAVVPSGFGFSAVVTSILSEFSFFVGEDGLMEGG